jgi:hypothetical protein
VTFSLQGEDARCIILERPFSCLSGVHFMFNPRNEAATRLGGKASLGTGRCSGRRRLNIVPLDPTKHSLTRFKSTHDRVGAKVMALVIEYLRTAPSLHKYFSSTPITQIRNSRSQG